MEILFEIVFWSALEGVLANSTGFMEREHSEQLQRALPRVLAVHWRRGDFVAAKSGQKQKVCTDELTATPLPNGCEWHTIIRTPDELAAVIRKRMGEYNATELFLATNAGALLVLLSPHFWLVDVPQFAVLAQVRELRLVESCIVLK